ncbi:MAG: ParB N-terminal domain-containing protein [Velocimicrobium sp.]
MKKSKELCSLWNNEQDLQTGNVKISELHEFKGHPFRVEHDMQLFELSKSIEEKGVLVPLIVRPNPAGEGYEIIAGHRRKAACEWAGVDTGKWQLDSQPLEKEQPRVRTDELLAKQIGESRNQIARLHIVLICAVTK